MLAGGEEVFKALASQKPRMARRSELGSRRNSE
jgi:hypothetical protein